MSAGNFICLDKAKLKWFNQTIKLNSDQFKAALVTSSFAASAAFVGTSSDARYADIASVEAVGTGYTIGGLLLTTYLTSAGGTVTFDADDIVWAASTIAAKYVVIYDNTGTNKDIVGYMDLETTSASGVSSTNGAFSITWNPSGFFTVA